MYHQHKQYLSNLIDSDDNNKNLKRFWHYVKSKRRDSWNWGIKEPGK